VDSVAQLRFDKICPGHGPVRQDWERMTNMRNYN
jgi:hypothetical protein